MIALNAQANRIANTINETFGPEVAIPMDSTSIRVRTPENPSQKVSFIGLLENINFNIEYNLLKDQLKIIDITINDKTPDNIDNIEEILQTYNTQDRLRITNWIDLKNFVNKIFDNYFG